MKDEKLTKSTNNEKHGTFNQKWSVEEQVCLFLSYRDDFNSQKWCLFHPNPGVEA